MIKKYQPYIISGIIIAATFFAAGSGIAQKINFNPIKPAAKTVLMTDEQQAIAAVRLAKASVVNIIGAADASQQATGTGLSVISGNLTAIYGTGFVLGSDGTVVSNNHVVSNNNLKYSVVLVDGTQYPATIVGLDRFDDVALLKIEAKNLTPAKLGDSDNLETGQTVFAIGNSLGQYQYTVTRGVVSALGRSVDEQNDNSSNVANRLHNLIQTDASINPGNSGGQLINLAGEVVGMNTLIDTGGSGLGFAIPVNNIKDAISQLKTFGKVSRPFLGVQFVKIDPAVKIAKQLSVDNGALVLSVLDGTPAASAGILANDIITAVNGAPLNQSKALDDVIQAFPCGRAGNFYNFTCWPKPGHNRYTWTETINTKESRPLLFNGRLCLFLHQELMEWR